MEAKFTYYTFTLTTAQIEEAIFYGENSGPVGPAVISVKVVLPQPRQEAALPPKPPTEAPPKSDG